MNQIRGLKHCGVCDYCVDGDGLCECSAGPTLEYENTTLNEREHTHGDYAQTALIAQKLKAVIEHSGKFIHMHEVQRESLHLICTKLARIISGNNNDPDHWKDIAGYANLVSERLK